MNVIISANNLTKIYGEKETSVTALDNININFNEMQFTAIMGPSGSGKSTLLHCLAGLDRPSSGQIYLKDSDISKLNDKQLTKIRRDSFGFVFQAFNLIPTLTAEENITLPASIAGKKPDMDWVKKVVDTVDISDRLTHRPNELSGGQQQRVAVARAIAGSRPLLLADEPTGNLDVKAGESIIELFRELCSDSDDPISVLMVTHDPLLASKADRMLLMRDGVTASSDIRSAWGEDAGVES